VQGLLVLSASVICKGSVKVFFFFFVLSLLYSGVVGSCWFPRVLAELATGCLFSLLVNEILIHKNKENNKVQNQNTESIEHEHLHPCCNTTC
jgi:hypothetical protein